nr:hypothetical protein [Pandoravirus massiliensis]
MPTRAYWRLESQRRHLAAGVTLSPWCLKQRLTFFFECALFFFVALSCSPWFGRPSFFLRKKEDTICARRPQYACSVSLFLGFFFKFFTLLRDRWQVLSGERVLLPLGCTDFFFSLCSEARHGQARAVSLPRADTTGRRPLSPAACCAHTHTPTAPSASFVDRRHWCTRSANREPT